jgi:hypothetical protein
MNILVLALRNLLRNRRRSLTTLLAMIIGGVCQRSCRVTSRSLL